MTSDPSKKVTGGLRVFWRRIRRIAGPYWASEEKGTARALLAIVVLLLGAQTAFNVLYVGQVGEFTSALAAQDADRFWAAIKLFAITLVASVPTYAFYYYVRDKLALRWRRWMTRDLLDAYLRDRAYYELNARGTIDNPDQRIAEDINTFTHESLWFMLVGLGSLIQLVAFAGVLWSISKELVIALAVYAVVGNAVVTGGFGRLLVRLNFLQLRREADFRFALVRLREHAEPIALLRGEAYESARAMDYFAAVFANYTKIIRTQLGLGFFQYGFSFLALALPYMVTASRVLSGELEVGRAVQAAGAFAAVLSAVTIIIDHFERLSRFAAGVDRLNDFAKEVKGRPPSPAGSSRRIRLVDSTELAFEHLTVQTPQRERTLIRELSTDVPHGRGLMIVGDSGSGKSSLLRAIGGLWSSGSGRILRPALADIMFLPQQPYMVLGTLRNQLTYPNKTESVGEDAMRAVLARVNLDDLLERVGGFEAERDWAKMLSLGEQQRLAFARVLLAAPRYAMLDEASSALDADNEKNLYQQLLAAGTTPVSISHRPGLLAYHDHVLELPGDGSWHLHSAQSYGLSLEAEQEAVRDTVPE